MIDVSPTTYASNAYGSTLRWQSATPAVGSTVAQPWSITRRSGEALRTWKQYVALTDAVASESTREEVPRR